MITGQVNEAEFLRAHRLHRRKPAVVVNVALLCLAVVAAVVFVVASRKLGTILMFAVVGGLVGEAIQGRLLIPRRLRKRYRQRRGRTDVTYSWDASTLLIRSEHGEAARPWTTFVKAREDESVILLYLDDAHFEIIAKRWFHSPAQLDDFRSRPKLAPG